MSPQKTATGTIEVGDPAPELELPDQDGNLVRLTDLRGSKHVVLFFYPHDETTVCTIEACAFRDASEDFSGLDAVILGVSTDSEGSHRRFREKHGLPYTLLSDRKDVGRQLFGVSKQWLIPGRTTFVIDKQGVVRHIYASQARGQQHVVEALEAVRRLSAVDGTAP